jgi:hypothetical protein
MKMIQWLKQLLMAFAFVFALVGHAIAGSISDAEDAFDSGDYEKAAILFRRLADQGSADAQINLGMLYYRGQGVAQDYPEAASWYRLSSKQGNAFAQFDLGLMYEDGRGVMQDNTQAYKWLSIAATNATDSELKGRVASQLHSIGKLMTVEQITEAKKLARNCTLNNFKTC